jgi:hypothetical protein
MLISTITTDLTTPPYTTYQSSGPTTGGNQIIITGTNLVPSSTKNQTTDYIQSGLQLHYDAKNNLGSGDTNHSSSTTTWYDLSGNSRHGALCGAQNCSSNYYSWTSDALNLNGLTNWIKISNFTTYFSSLSLETVSNMYSPHPLGSPSPTRQSSLVAAQVGYGGAALMNFYNSPLAVGIWGQASYNGAMAGCYISSDQYLNKRHSISGTFSTNLQFIRLDNLTNNCNQSLTLPTITGYYGLGANVDSSGVALISENYANLYGQISSARIYNRAITKAESFTNCWIDKYRFNLPNDTCLTITIDETPCTNIEIISTSKITCTAPPHTDGYTNISVNNGIENYTLTKAYLYRDFTANLSVPTSISFPTIPPDSTITTTTQSITASTNYLNGYTLTIQMSNNDNRLTFTDQKGTTHYLEPTNPTTHPTTLSPNSWGLKLSSTSYIPIPPKNQPYTIKSTTTPNTSPDTTPITFAARADINQVAGQYKGTILYTLTTN